MGRGAGASVPSPAAGCGLLGLLDRNGWLLLLAKLLPAVGHVPPQASFLAWLDFGALGLGSDPAAVLLRHGRVALNQASSSAARGAGFVRLNIGISAALMIEAVDRMAKESRERPHDQPGRTTILSDMVVTDRLLDL